MKKIAIILAGGSGTRLWPLSTEKHPKPLLEFFNHKTLLEETIFRAKLFADDIFVLTTGDVNQAAHDEFKSLGIKHNNVFIEPRGADTGAAIAFGIAQVKKRYGKKTIVVLTPVDHRIKNYGAFYRDMTFAISSAIEHHSVVLFGITPSFPSTGYGYIKVGRKISQSDRDSLLEVDSFHEKPNEPTAKEFAKSADHVWNSGIYVATIASFEGVLRINRLLFKWYKSLASIGRHRKMPFQFKEFQFEHGIIESSDNLTSVIATFDWADIGSYDELSKSTAATDNHGNAINGNAEADDCINCLIIGRSKKIIALGLNDIAIVDSPDGILVCRKSTHSQLVGQIATESSQEES